MSVPIDLPESTWELLHAAAERHGVSASELIRELVEELPVETEPVQRDLDFFAIGASTSGMNAVDADEMLADGFGRD